MSGEPGLKNKWQMKSRQQNWETVANFLLWERSGENPTVPLLATGLHQQINLPQQDINSKKVPNMDREFKCQPAKQANIKQTKHNKNEGLLHL